MKFLTASTPLNSFPKNQADTLWLRIEEMCDLTPPEVSALKNESTGPSTVSSLLCVAFHCSNHLTMTYFLAQTIHLSQCIIKLNPLSRCLITPITNQLNLALNLDHLSHYDACACLSMVQNLLALNFSYDSLRELYASFNLMYTSHIS